MFHIVGDFYVFNLGLDGFSASIYLKKSSYLPSTKIHHPAKFQWSAFSNKRYFWFLLKSPSNSFQSAECLLLHGPICCGSMRSAKKKKFDRLQKSYHKTLPMHNNLFSCCLLMAIIQTSFWRVLFSFLQCVPKKLLFWTPCIYLVFWRFDRIIFWGMSKLWTKTFNF